MHSISSRPSSAFQKPPPERGARIDEALLTTEQEDAVARAIVAAERKVLEAIARAPSGAAELGSLGHDLEQSGGIRSLILNPDESGIDLAVTSERVRTALLAATSSDERERSAAVEVLADVRIDLAVIERLISAVRQAGDAAALEEIAVAQRHMRRAKERLVVANLRLVLLHARKYQNEEVSLLDLVQEGNVGLMRAADKFDGRRGFRFTTYASYWIKQALQRALVQRTVRLPIHLADDLRRIARVRSKFVTQNEREPDSEEIATLTGLSVGRVLTVLALPAQPASLDAPVGEDGNARLVDFVAAETTPADEAVAAGALGEHLHELLSGLSERELRVLRMRFGIGTEREHTLDEIGRELSLTRERIRQIERDALRKLRARSKTSELESFLRA